MKVKAALFSFLASALILGSSLAHALDTYKIDPSHSAVVFKVNHLGFTHVYGQFPKVEGEFKVDGKKGEKESITVTVDANSITTHEAKRDKHLKNADFFDVKQFPTITFKSDSVTKKGGNKYEVKGQLSLHGVTKPVTFTLDRGRTGKDPWGNTRTGGDAQFTIKRSDFGMNYMQGENQVSDEVTLFLAVEGIKQ